jgi:hypothetical protein
MLTAFGRDENEACAACFSGRYPVALTVPDPQATLFPSDEPREDVSGEKPATSFPRLVRAAKP